jgi:hypothetical protein
MPSYCQSFVNVYYLPRLSSGVKIYMRAIPTLKTSISGARGILLCARWYLRYSLSYRDLKEMMRERGLSVDHTTIYRWVQAYAPELEERIRPHNGYKCCQLWAKRPRCASSPSKLALWSIFSRI